jgi:integrase
VIHNTVCSLLLRESKIYREIEVVNMWWTTIIVVALLAFGIAGFVSMVRLFSQRLTSETTRRAEDMYDQYADSPRERHRRSLAHAATAPFSLIECLARPGERETWSEAEVRKFLAKASSDRLHVAWSLSLHGLRRGEVLGLRWSDIDLRAETLTVNQARVPGRVSGPHRGTEVP